MMSVGPDPLPGQTVEDAVIRLRIEAPKAGFPDVREPRTKLVPKQAKKTKNQIAVPIFSDNAIDEITASPAARRAS